VHAIQVQLTQHAIYLLVAYNCSLVLSACLLVTYGAWQSSVGHCALMPALDVTFLSYLPVMRAVPLTPRTGASTSTTSAQPLRSAPTACRMPRTHPRMTAGPSVSPSSTRCGPQLQCTSAVAVGSNQILWHGMLAMKQSDGEKAAATSPCEQAVAYLVLNKGSHVWGMLCASCCRWAHTATWVPPSQILGMWLP
jgi:hypothetical protein